MLLAARSAARGRARLGVLTTTGAALLAGAHLLGVVPGLGGPGAGTASGLGAVVAYAVLLGAQLRLLRERLLAWVLHAWLDAASGVLCLLALGCTVALEPLREATGAGGPAALLLLVRASTSVMMLVLAVATSSFQREVRDARVLLFAAGAGALALVDTGSVLGALGLLGAVGGGPGPVTRVAVGVLVAALLVLAAWRPRPPGLVARDADTPAVVVPAVVIVLCCTVLGLDHAVGVPTPAAAAALCCIAVTMVTVVLVFRQVASLQATRHQALTDELTGLGNRRALVARLEGVDAGAPLALVLVDLDRFKEVNDVLGHGAGDELLRQVAARLLAGSPDGETVVRQGGDEFALVLPGVTAAVAAARATDLVRRLGQPFPLGAREVSVAASVGVAAAPEHATDAEELQRRADSAMYRAKAAGGGVQVYDHRVDAERRDEAALVDELRSAVARGDLAVHFQPQLDAAGDLVGVEALVRWEHPDRGLLGPARFLGLAERHGLMDELTAVVLRRSLGQVAALGSGGHRLRVSVNVSATCLLDPRLVTTVAVLLAEHGVAAGDLLLEITETELMLDAEVSGRVVADLAALGVGVSIDDYGTGCSSLAHLKDLPVSELKLDRSFTAQLTSDRRTADIVRTTVDLAHSLGLLIVAEGVEDEPTLRRLRALGVDITQGYHHSRPLPAAELHRWVADHRAARPARHHAGSVVPGA